MCTRFVNTKNGTLAYIQKSVRVDGYPRTVTVKCLGFLSDIQKEQGCADPWKWVEELAASMTAEEKESRKKITVELSPTKTIDEGSVLCAMAVTLCCSDYIIGWDCRRYATAHLKAAVPSMP